MYLTRSCLLLMTGAAPAVVFVLSCGDNLRLKANADAAIDAAVDTAVDAPTALDAAPACNCPAAEPPLAGRFFIVSKFNKIPGNNFDLVGAACPAGSQVISGSCTQDLLNPYRNLTLQQSGFFEIAAAEWVCWFRNNSSDEVTVRASVICLQLSP